jgi:ABC-2 type transport system ATP-binding protein
MSTLLNAIRLQRSFHGRQVVEPLDLRLEAGDILGLLGPNGAGKSTIMRMLSGDLAPDGGRIEICGEDLLRRPVQAKRYLGFLPERPPLLRDQTVDEYLIDCARLRGLGRASSRTARERVKRQCGLDTQGRRLIGKLSKGYQQRVGLAQAIIHEPRVVILDEPTDGLDPAQIRQVRELIQALSQDRGVLLSSHNLSEIQASCNRVAILQEGRVAYLGDLSPPQETRYRVGLEQNPESSQIGALASVAEVEQLQANYFLVTLRAESGPGELARQIQAQNWGLIELAPERVSLEQRYFEATTGGGI